MHYSKSAAVFCHLFVLFDFASARFVKQWDYRSLFERADIVLIAAPQKTEDIELTTPAELSGVPVAGKRTTFVKLLSLKGADKIDKFSVKYFRLRPDADPPKDGPKLIYFRLSTLYVTILSQDSSPPYSTKLLPPQYLLFLIKNHDGDYEPVSGQCDSIFSAKEVYWPVKTGDQ